MLSLLAAEMSRRGGGGGHSLSFGNVVAIIVNVLFIHDNLSLTGEVLDCKCGVRQVVKV